MAIVVSPQSADASEFENTTLGISFIGLANGPEAPGQKAAQPRVGRGADEVRAGVAHGLERPGGAVIGASRGDPVAAPVRWCDVAVERDGHLQDQ